MKLLVFFCALLLAACNSKTDTQEQTKQQDKKVSYGIGYRVGSDMLRGEMGIDRNTLIQGIEDALDSKAPQFSPQEIQAAVVEFRQQRRQDQLKLAEANQTAGQRYQAEYRKQADVNETPSGIQYRIITEGAGNQPGPGDEIRVHYKGRLINGKEFDATAKDGEPTTLRVDQTIPGWQEILPLMHEGAKWEVVIPARLAYQLHGVPPSIGPNETLVFELNLVDIIKTIAQSPDIQKPLDIE